MKFQLNKEILVQKLTDASLFTSARNTTLISLTGVLLKKVNKEIHFYSTNLSYYFHSLIKTEDEEVWEIVVEPRKILEFISLLEAVKIDLEVSEKNLIVTGGKTRGTFPLFDIKDFPLPPVVTDKSDKIGSDVFLKNLPLVIFSAATDETRPVLTGVNLLVDDSFTMVTTDGFRLSLVKTKEEGLKQSMIVPSEFLSTLLRFLKEKKELEMIYSQKEKMAIFKMGETSLYSRLIEGDFPPFEKVIPVEKKTVVTLNRKELERATKAISVFAREYSNIVVLVFDEKGVLVRSKNEKGQNNSAQIECVIVGEKQTVAFNYKFLIDFLNHVEQDDIIIEVLRSDAPVVFKVKNNPGFLHVIMPVRIQE